MNDQTLTHKDLAVMAGVSVTTIKSYRRKFGEFIPVARLTKPIRFHTDAGPVCVRIRSLFSKGLSIQDITKKLSLEFDKDTSNQHLSISKTSAEKKSALSSETTEIAGLLKDMLKGMSASVTNQVGMERRLASIENSLKQLIELEVLREQQLERLEQRAAHFETLASRTPPESSGPVKRVVTVKSESGEKESYVFGSGMKESHEGIDSESDTEASGSAYGKASVDQDGPDSGISHNEKPAGRPSSDFLELPVAMHSTGGDFLGITGPDGRPFSLAAFERHLLTRSSGPGFPSSTWSGDGDTWTCTISGQDKSSINTMTFARTRTPRGNVVAHLSSMDVNGKRASEAFLQAFFREIKFAIGG